MNFTVELKVSVHEPDVGVMKLFANVIQDRFAGTAIKIEKVTITKDDVQE